MPAIPDTTKDPDAKRAAVSLLSQGLATKSEVARLAGVSRQLVQHWAQEIPIEANRNKVLAKVWRKAMADARSKR